ncbi:multidrug transporter [Flagellimonas aequoris]|uniref:Multidrug transporter n=1 Tax=Flagellimonas aequoris TaxID=2306997 RepID=A0A418N7G2_9FLAO|nr:multidrug transporter [Allomuricauda aequoris]RIV70666.1 multidrug transporter [Allomuricauda aequoris]TXK02103.1 multidrug transporter [Allomuricauda aequoris]
MKNKFLFLGIAAALFIACEADDTADIVINDNSVTNNTTTTGGSSEETEVRLSGVYTEDLTLETGKNYILTGSTIMASGTTLTIPAGTTIKAQAAGTSVYLAISQGAQIIADGNAANPIVFTSAASNPSAGDWGGLILLGRAPINSVTGTATSTSEIGNLPYGGNQSDDNSGILRYVRVEYSGGAADGQSENNGFSFYGVGNGTIVEYIEALEGDDDGLEFFGGTVDVRYVLVVNAADDSIDWTEGFSGSVTDAYVIQGDGIGDEAFECDGFNTDYTNATGTFSNPTVSNVTIVSESTSDSTRGFLLRAGTQGTFSNIEIIGKATGISVDDDDAGTPTSQNITDDTLTFTDVTFTNVGANTEIDGGVAEADLVTGIGNGTGTDFASWGTGWTVGVN